MASNAFADSLICKLQSGSQSASVTLDLNDQSTSQDGDYTNSVYDLNIHVLAECSARACGGTITVNSGTLEDEYNQLGYSFNRGKKDGVVLRETLTNTPDMRRYSISCIYKP